jgi:hypothetical protein
LTLQVWIPWISLAISVAVPIAALAGQKWLIARIEKGVQFKFEQKIEALRSELRKSEAEISTLRSQVFSGAAKRGELLDKRRFEAVDNTWAAMKGLAPYRLVSEMLMRVDLKKAEAESTNPNLQRFFATIAKIAPTEKPPSISAHAEQLYLSPLAWAYFHAYQAIVLLHFGTAKAFEAGLTDVTKLMKVDRIREILKAALPKDAMFIDQCELTDFALFLDDLENALLRELKNTLEGKEADQADLARATAINEAIKVRSDADISKDVGV